MARIGDGFEAGQGYDRFSALNGRGAFDNAYPIVDGYFLPDTVWHDLRARRAKRRSTANRLKRA